MPRDKLAAKKSKSALTSETTLVPAAESLSAKSEDPKSGRCELTREIMSDNVGQQRKASSAVISSYSHDDIDHQHSSLLFINGSAKRGQTAREHSTCRSRIDTDDQQESIMVDTGKIVDIALGTTSGDALSRGIGLMHKKDDANRPKKSLVYDISKAVPLIAPSTNNVVSNPTPTQAPPRSFLNSPAPAKDQTRKRPPPPPPQTSFPDSPILVHPVQKHDQLQQQMSTTGPARFSLNSPVPAKPAAATKLAPLQQSANHLNGTKQVKFTATTKVKDAQPRPRGRPKKRKLVNDSAEISSATTTGISRKAYRPNTAKVQTQTLANYAGVEVQASHDATEAAPPKNELFSPVADDNLRVLYFLTRNYLAKGEIRTALEMCHEMLRKSYEQATKKLVIMFASLLNSKNRIKKKRAIADIMLIRERTAGIWCLYAHLFTEIVETNAFQDSINDHDNEGCSQEEALTAEEKLWDQSIAVLSLCTVCPLVGNHSSISIGLSRLRLRKRQRGSLRPVPSEEASITETTTFPSNPTSTLAHWRDNMQAALQICRDSLEILSPLGSRKRQQTDAHLAGVLKSAPKEASVVKMEVFKATSDQSAMLGSLVERNCEESERDPTGPPASFVFFSSPLNLLLKLEDTLREHAPNQQPLKGAPLPYLFTDRCSTHILCLEMNCLSRLNESLKHAGDGNDSHLLFAQTHLSSNNTAAQLCGVSSWDDTLHFQSMNAVLLHSDSEFYPSQLATHLAMATPFFRSDTSSPIQKDFDELNEIDAYSKTPSYYLWHSLVYMCHKCDYLCESRVKLVLHGQLCEAHGKNAYCRKQDTLWQAWEDLSFMKEVREIKESEEQVRFRATKTSLRALKNECCDIVEASECQPQKRGVAREHKVNTSIGATADRAKGPPAKAGTSLSSIFNEEAGNDSDSGDRGKEQTPAGKAAAEKKSGNRNDDEQTVAPRAPALKSEPDGSPVGALQQGAKLKNDTGTTRPEGKPRGRKDVQKRPIVNSLRQKSGRRARSEVFCANS